MNTLTKPSSKKGNAAKRTLISLGVIVLLIAIAYFVGLSKGRGQAAAIKTAADTRVSTAQQQSSQARNQLTTTQTQASLMRARTEVYRAALALDQRNFGTANDDLKKAAALLAPIQPADVGANAAAFDTVRQALNTTNITIADDLETQRGKLLELTTQMDALIPEETP